MEDAMLNEPYILYEDRKLAYDWQSLQNLPAESWKGCEEYTDFSSYSNLRSWWYAHYDEKGIACSYELHGSILRDVKSFILRYNDKYGKHLALLPEKGNEVFIFFNEEDLPDKTDYTDQYEDFEDIFNSMYKGVKNESLVIKDNVITIKWDNLALKRGI